MIWNDGLVWCMHRVEEVFLFFTVAITCLLDIYRHGWAFFMLPSSDVGVAYTAFSSPMMMMMMMRVAGLMLAFFFSSLLLIVPLSLLSLSLVI